ncbi:MAG TPA: cyclic nucleotide-binding domain-containing protein [Cellvibrionaceae bacterium]
MRQFESNQTPRADIDFEQTHSLVPLKDMGESYVRALLDKATAEYIYAGQNLFVRGSVDNTHIYLLYGDVSLEDDKQQCTAIKGRQTLLPLAHFQPRKHNAVAVSDCAILRIDSEQLDKLLTWSQVTDYLHSIISRERDMDEDVEWMMTVLHSNLFFKVPPLNVEQIFSEMHAECVEKGQVILRQGEIGEHCYFIKEGSAEVTRQNSEGKELLASIGPGRCFGEDALVNDAPRNATVTMSTDGVLMSLPKHAFYRLLKSPAVASLGLTQLYAEPATQKVLIDVRSDEEYAQGHLPMAANIPLHLLGIKSRLLSLTSEYVLYCDTTRRSSAATHLLAEQGFKVQLLSDAHKLFDGREGANHYLLERNSNYMLRGGVAVIGQ